MIQELQPPEFDTPGKRLAWLRGVLNLTLEEFGRRCHYHGAHISRVERGIVQPVRRFVTMVCEAYRIREEWLLCGREPVFMQKQAVLANSHPGSAPEIADVLIQTIRHAANLSPEGRNMLKDSLHHMVDILCQPTENALKTYSETALKRSQ